MQAEDIKLGDYFVELWVAADGSLNFCVHVDKDHYLDISIPKSLDPKQVAIQ